VRAIAGVRVRVRSGVRVWLGPGLGVGLATPTPTPNQRGLLHSGAVEGPLESSHLHLPVLLPRLHGGMVVVGW
jgi:hypothetical protein